MKVKVIHIVILICLSVQALKAQVQPARIEKKFQKYIDRSEITGNNQAENLVLVNFKRILTPAEIEQLKPRKSISATCFIVEKPFVLSLLNETNFEAKANGLWKASDQLIKLLEKEFKKEDLILVRLALKTQGNQPPDFLNPYKIAQFDAENRLAKIYINPNDLIQLLLREEILYADVEQLAKPDVVINGIDLGLNQVSNTRVAYPAINGNGINVSFKEGMYDTKDLDLLGKTIPGSLIGSPVTTHATIMATLALGNGNSFIRGTGVAPSAKLAFSSFANLMPDAVTDLKSLNIRVQNHSYGTDLDNVYGIEAAAYDKQIYETDTLIHVFSAGNKGTSTPGSGLYKDLAAKANLTGNFKQAKNLLVIGGINRENLSETLSSRGPAYDGRVKPELVALGEDGTSGSAAVTSGVVALLEQYHLNKTGKIPSSALVKAVLINSAEDLGTPQVDYTYGYGKLNAFQALKTLEENRFLGKEIQANQNLVIPLTIPANVSEVKVTVTWNDPPAIVNDAKSLVNRLEMNLENPAGGLTLPWVLSSFPNLDSLNKPATQKIDLLNNVQQITINEPLSGDYKINIKGAEIKQGNSQRFYLAYSYKLKNTFSFISPEKDEFLFAGEDNYIRWDNTFPVQTGALSVSYDEGKTWNLLNANADLSNGFYRWNAPNLFSKAMIKMEVSGNIVYSKSFVLSAPRNLTVGYACTDAVALSWNPQPNAKDYTIFTLVNDKLSPLINTTDTIIKFDRRTLTSNYFAVAANGQDFSGLKSYTIDYTQQGVSCYTRSLSAFVTSDQKIQLDLSIGTTLDLKNIIWEKQTGVNTFTTLKQTTVNGNQLSYSIFDDNPKNGLQFYRVTFETNNGKVVSDLASVVYLKPDDFSFYPNPVNDYLTILSGSFETYSFAVFNILGQKIFEDSATSSNKFDLSKLSAGVYVGVIIKNGQQLSKFKIIKN
ncbi:S8 family peptidase [Pedobacter rhodius]|uniref:S8 family peptidase n=1 Tax=Pedobacter rhodius TaxID=3004098 RepID=A0ABT4KTW6_9SPHI|nr:S8 family peptidase [Pedobacter sp. SJ11]MCZ4222269.1 S8 family peptidase [Pedobacter sp. SJ11]